MSLSDLSIRNPVFAVMLSAAMIVFGYLGYQEMCPVAVETSGVSGTLTVSTKPSRPAGRFPLDQIADAVADQRRPDRRQHRDALAIDRPDGPPVSLPFTAPTMLYW